jgi:hypothetical protein
MEFKRITRADLSARVGGGTRMRVPPFLCMMPAMPTKLFQKTVEDFTCEHCGAMVKGSGYTNHCPKCLWSRHVDINPGDRAAACRGMMKPISVETKGDGYMLLQRCVVCGHERRNRVVKGDDFDAVIKLSIPEGKR